MHFRIFQIQFGRVKPHQNTQIVSRVVPDLINLILERKRRRKLLHPRELWIFDKNRRVKGSPGMLVEVAANHLAVFRPIGECNWSASNTTEPLPILFATIMLTT